jgi:hypothetical protein
MAIWIKQLLVGFIVERLGVEGKGLGVEGKVLHGQNGEWLDEG